MKHSLISLALITALTLCSCSAADSSVGAASSDDHSAAEDAQSITSDDTQSEEPVSEAAGEENTSSYFPPLLESAAELDDSAELPDFDRMMKEVSEFDVNAFVQDHSIALDHFTGRADYMSKLFIELGKKTFWGKWYYGNYILHLAYDPKSDCTFFFLYNSHSLSGAYIKSVYFRKVDENGRDVELTEADSIRSTNMVCHTREEIDAFLGIANYEDPDSVPDYYSPIPDYMFDGIEGATPEDYGITDDIE